MSDQNASSSPQQESTPPAAPPPSRLRSFLIRWAKRLGILAALVIVGLVVAEHQTSKPEFCASCHIMQPYYETWQADVHGSSKLGIACVECHYAPGEKTTLKAKMRGLSQLVSYFSGRYGKGRPRAFVDNMSCMTSNCHGDNRFMDKELTMGSVRFSHAKHLLTDGKKQEEVRKELEALSATLRKDLGDKVFDELEPIARLAIHADEIEARMRKVAIDQHAQVDAKTLQRFSQLYHRDVRLAQLIEIQCTNCHSYGSPVHPIPGQEMAHHFSVKTSSCITCHFNNESFNTGTTSCLLCHKLPEKQITVHEALTPEQQKKLKSPELTKKPVTIDHAEMVKRKVSCYSCHADVAVRNTPVSKRDCDRCHDRPEYFKDWKETLTLDSVKHYHEVHVPAQRAKCLDCHSEIHHQIVRKDTPLGQPAFLTSAIAKCTQCHPNHHAEQIELLTGTGGVGVPKGNPNLMFGSRTNCFGCHQEQVIKKHGGLSVQGTIAGCISCHGDKHKDTYEQWKLGIKVTMMDAEEAFDQATKRLAASKDLDAATRQKATELLNGCQEDLLLVKRGNGVHNVTYSIDLLDSVTRRAQQVLALLAQAQKKS